MGVNRDDLPILTLTIDTFAPDGELVESRCHRLHWAACQFSGKFGEGVCDTHLSNLCENDPTPPPPPAWEYK